MDSKDIPIDIKTELDEQLLFFERKLSAGIRQYVDTYVEADAIAHFARQLVEIMFIDHISTSEDCVICKEKVYGE